MTKQLLFSILFFFSFANRVLPQQGIYNIITTDIDNFWIAYDKLKEAKSQPDSINILQQFYLNQATTQFKKFIRLRNFTAQEYATVIALYPEYWQSIRSLTENIKNRKNEIDRIFKTFSDSFPNFKTPDICFAIGCIRVGGTTSKKTLLIGAEIAAADSTVITTELNTRQRKIIENSQGLIPYIAHETVHVQQSGFPFGEFFKLLKHSKMAASHMMMMMFTMGTLACHFIADEIFSEIKLSYETFFFELTDGAKDCRDITTGIT